MNHAPAPPSAAERYVRWVTWTDWALAAVFGLRALHILFFRMQEGAIWSFVLHLHLYPVAFFLARAWATQRRRAWARQVHLVLAPVGVALGLVSLVLLRKASPVQIACAALLPQGLLVVYWFRASKCAPLFGLPPADKSAARGGDGPPPPPSNRPQG